MALIQGRHGKRGATAMNPNQAGVTATSVYELDLTSQAITAASDVIELGPLPAKAQLISATIIGTGVGAITATIGVLTGEAGDPLSTRALAGGAGTVITAQSVNDTEATTTRAAALGVTPSDTHRGIGGTVSANIAAGAGKKLRLVLQYFYP